jgi:hypothetical protein
MNSKDGIDIPQGAVLRVCASKKAWKDDMNIPGKIQVVN